MRKRTHRVVQAEYRQERFLKSLRQRLAGFILLLCGALIVETALFVFTSPRLTISRVQVRGAGTELTPWASKEVSAALNRNLFLAPVNEVRKRLEANPLVEKAAIHRRLPPAVVAEVTPRKAYVVVDRKGDLYALDSSMVPFRKLEKPAAGIPLFIAPAACVPKFGRQWNDRFIRECDLAYRLAQKADLRPQSISIDPVGDMCLNIRNAVQIRAGSPDDINKKLWIVSRFLTSHPVSPGSIEYVDVSCPAAPVFRLKSARQVSAVP